MSNTKPLLPRNWIPSSLSMTHRLKLQQAVQLSQTTAIDEMLHWLTTGFTTDPEDMSKTPLSPRGSRIEMTSTFGNDKDKIGTRLFNLFSLLQVLEPREFPVSESATQSLNQQMVALIETKIQSLALPDDQAQAELLECSFALAFVFFPQPEKRSVLSLRLFSQAQPDSQTSEKSKILNMLDRFNTIAGIQDHIHLLKFIYARSRDFLSTEIIAHPKPEQRSLISIINSMTTIMLWHYVKRSPSTFTSATEKTFWLQEQLRTTDILSFLPSMGSDLVKADLLFLRSVIDMSQNDITEINDNLFCSLGYTALPAGFIDILRDLSRLKVFSPPSFKAAVNESYNINENNVVEMLTQAYCYQEGIGVPANPQGAFGIYTPTT